MVLKDELLGIIPDEARVSANETVLDHHSKGFSYHTPVLPDAVVFPKTEEEVVKIVHFAKERSIPIVPFGVGTSLEGHVIPVKGGISIDFSLMNRIVELRPEDFIVKVEPGVTRIQLNKHLKKYGLFFPVDPGADATIGGMTATNASGTNAVRYGAMKQNVLGLRCVLADGRVIPMGGETVKSSAGLHLADLMIGLEGTLGIFTEITLKLYGIPEAIVAAKVVFPNLKAAGGAATAVLQGGIPIGRIELVDSRTIEAINLYKGTDLMVHPTLFLEFAGSREMVQHDIQMTREIMEDNGCLSFEFEEDSIKRAQLWEARHQAAVAITSKYPGKLHVSTDVCVPISKLTGALEKARQLAEAYHLDAAILGHVGDGNFHTSLAIDPNDQDEVGRFQKMNEALVDYALQQGGTCTGEHGIGIGKKKYLLKEHPEGLDVMRTIKKALDPEGILNPGKID
ncbi:FAD-linked oxidase C-terminal domain-containing protein [Bacillus sp. FSL W8-0102]|uniref:FAD-binding oxidoreductase n=1 Tax=Bacillus sp. FSL W8-0102 TaxID=2978205 RepID=UPI0030F8929B